MFVLEYLMFAACSALSPEAAFAEGFFPKGSLSLLLGTLTLKYQKKDKVLFFLFLSFCNLATSLKNS